MPFIQQSKPEPGCLFCNLVRQEDDEANYIVYRGPRCFVMLNLYPYNSGHLMVAPYLHVGSLEQVPSEVGTEIFETTQLSLRALEELMHPEGFNLGINQGAVSGAGVADHIHLHVVPRWNGDTNFMPVLADTKVVPELLGATAAKLRPALQRLAEER
jgi:ATP adenylyltransferase